MIAKKAEYLLSLSRLTSQLEKCENDRKDLGFVGEELSARAGQLREANQSADLLRNHQIVVMAPNLDRARNYAVRVRKRLTDSPLTVKGGADFSRLLQNLDEGIQTLEEHRAAAWKKWIAEERPRVSEVNLSLLEGSADCRVLVGQIRQFGSEIDKLVARPPRAEAEFQLAKKKLDQLRELLARLPELPNKPTLNTFLTEVNRGGASLDLLTQDVIADLKELGLYNSLQIVWADLPDRTPPGSRRNRR